MSISNREKEKDCITRLMKQPTDRFMITLSEKEKLDLDMDYSFQEEINLFYE